jgi:hypothetical protein
VGKAQERDLRAEIVSRWHFWSVRLAREAARKTTFEEVRDYLDEKMAEDVAQKVKGDVQTIYPGIDVDQVRRLWKDRKGGKFRSATYGLGTWLLGESARAELDKDKEKKEKEPEKGSQAEARKRLEERIKRYIDNQKLARQSIGSEDKSEDPQLFWEGWEWAGRSQWVLAHFAEKSGEFQDIKARLSNCRTCGGTGFRNLLLTGNAGSSTEEGKAGSSAGEVLVPCPGCHKIGIVRGIRYR